MKTLEEQHIEHGALYLVLYSRKDGGGARGFECRHVTSYGTISNDDIHCGKVVRTWRGFKSHLWLVHGLKLQQEWWKL